MEKLTKTNQGQTRQVDSSGKYQSRLLAFLNEDAVTFGELHVNNLTVILLCAVFALHNPMPAFAVAVLFGLHSMLRRRAANANPNRQQQE